MQLFRSTSARFKVFNFKRELSILTKEKLTVIDMDTNKVLREYDTKNLRG